MKYKQLFSEKEKEKLAMKTPKTNLGTIDGALKRLNLITAGCNVSLDNVFEQHEKIELGNDKISIFSSIEDLYTELMNLRHCLNNIETELKVVREANGAAIEELAFYKEEYYKHANGSE